uniref:Uncharacterized protein n=1 Tax=Siphoviridae sp. ctjBn3 TaxID=2825630 RepID=A0A8S5PMI7_9CAUD|nr:MAG TPA: hypothetical protein [Siphoviridae sp. ctjBn3]DAZ82883.1 MAG TPA: hypothetical protein [Caudoviricetes sp.]
MCHDPRSERPALQERTYPLHRAFPFPGAPCAA